MMFTFLSVAILGYFVKPGIAGLSAPPPGPVQSWRPVFRQTLPGLWKAGQLSVNASDDTSDMFAILDKLDSFKSKSGGFNFKLRWADPYMSETMTWKQTSNPYLNRTAGVVGYEPIYCPHTGNDWGGLEYDTTKSCLMDGSIGGSALWYYCVGYNGTDWGQGLSIPSFDRPAYAVSLFVKNPKTMRWTLMLRQTLPHLIDQWVLNKDDPWSESYAALDELEKYRNPADGKFELAMNWPDRYNTWHQTNNPVTAPVSATGPVPGYKPIHVQFTGAYWGGLQHNANQSNSVLEGSVGAGATWFYAIGYQGANWGMKLIPAYQDGGQYIGANEAELFVLVEK